MAGLVWTSAAIDDLLEIAEVADKVSIKYSRSLILRLMEKPEILRMMPEMGRVVPEINHPAIRELFEKHYRIIYRTQGDRIEILSVVSSSKSL